jgi:hypothetical protein
MVTLCAKRQVVTMVLKRSLVALWVMLCLAAPKAMFAGIEDIDDEGDFDRGKEVPGSEWKEEAVVMPPYPQADNLLEIDLSLPQFPFTLFIDAQSLSVGKDRVIRYTAVLRSRNGVENVSYEGIRCKHSQVQRYAYGSGGRFRPVRNRAWRFIRKDGQDRFRTELVNRYFCPLPMGDTERQILDKLKSGD